MSYKECARLLEADEKKYTKDDVKERLINNPQYCFGNLKTGDLVFDYEH